MHIVFDMAYDQSVAPDGVTAGQASIGKLFVGPQGLLGLLETHLGLTGKATHHADRISGYLRCMKANLTALESAFYKPSFEADPWSSAKQFLAWRDELVLAGWQGQTSDSFSPRLKALAKLEQSLDTGVKKGLGDKLNIALSALQNVSNIAIERIDLLEPLETLEPLLQSILKQLSKLGVKLEVVESAYAKAEGNLGLLQAAIRSGKQGQANAKSNDESVVLLEAEDEWAAANVVASWLKANEIENSDVVIIQGQGSDTLDSALESSGLPVLGNNQRSAWRAALQVLPLALANAWAPLDIKALLSFLSLPRSPVPSFAARWLREAIQSEPGIGGESWQDAEQKIITDRTNRLVKEGISEDKAKIEAEAFMASINHHLTGLRFSPSEGIPPEALVEMCAWVKKGLKAPDLKESMAQAIAQVEKMMDLAKDFQSPIPRAQVERMLDSVIAEGGQNPMARSQASQWANIADAGALAGPVNTVIWWDFTDPGQSPQTFWSEPERKQLESVGVHLVLSKQVRAREGKQWRNAIAYAGKRLILVSPSKVGGQATQPHPLWDEIRHFASQDKSSEAEQEQVAESLTTHASELTSKPACDFAGRAITLIGIPSSVMPNTQETMSISAGNIKAPEKLSYSQMSTLMGCPAKWALDYHARLSAMDSLSLPTGNQMIGSLCHKVIEDLYTKPMTWVDKDANKQAAQVERETKQRFDKRVAQMAAELLEPGRELELHRYRENVRSAVLKLIAAIDKAGLKVVETEAEVSGKKLGKIPFRGFIDLLLEDEQGNTFVIDLKWSGSLKYRKEEVEKGKALQLASYAWMLKSDSGKWAPGAYFMLAQGELLTGDTGFEIDPIESPLSSEEIWKSGSQTWSNLFLRLQSGSVEFSGLIDEKEQEAQMSEQGLMYSKAPCHFCDFGKLCGKTRAQA